MSETPRARVLVVDDSAFARKVVREVLSADPELEVVDIARDGLEALERISELRPDVVTLDLVMPNLDGIGVLRALPEGGPRVVVVSVTGVHTELALAALENGAFDLVQKPTALATDRMYEMGAELRRKVRDAARAPRASGGLASPPPLPPARRVVPLPPKLIVIGASTGGPPALARLFAELPEDLEAAVAVAVHLPAEYTEAFARRLDQLSPLRVLEAEDGMLLAPGTVLVAPGGQHLHIVRERAGGDIMAARVDAQPLGAAHRPSVDVLFSSAAAATGAATLGVVLTGMGNDGLVGAGAIRTAGGRVLTESEASCVVYGMPRSVVEAGLSDGNAPIERMGELIVAQVRGDKR